MPSRQLRPVLQYLHRTAGDPAGSPTDAELLERFVTGGDHAAFELLVWRHERMVLGVCRRLLSDPQDAEDAFQATFLVLVRSARSVRKGESLASWLYGVAYRCAGKARTRTRRRARSEHGGHDLAGVGIEDERLAAAEHGEVWAVLDEEVERLPEKYRAPVVLCYLEGKTYDEAGRHLGCHRATVSTRLTKARELLRNRLAARGVAVPAAAFATVLCTHAARAAAPAALVNATVQVAAQGAAGGSAGTVPAAVVALTEGVTKIAFARSLEALAGVCMLAGALVAGAWVLVGEGKATPVAAVAASEPRDRPAAFLSPVAAPKVLPGDGQIRWLAWGPDADTLVGLAVTYDEVEVAGSGGPKVLAERGVVKVWDRRTGQARTLVDEKTSGRPLALSPDGKTLAIGIVPRRPVTDPLEVWLVDVGTGKVTQKLEFAGRLSGVAFAPDGKTLAVGGTGGGGFARSFTKVQLWDLPPKKEPAAEIDGEREVNQTTAGVFALAVFPCMTEVVVAGPDHKIRVWDVKTGKWKETVFEGHTDVVHSLAFTPDGKTLVSGSSDKTVRVWNVETGKERRTLERKGDITSTVSLSRDGKFVAAAVGGKDGDQVVVWDLKSGKVRGTAEAGGPVGSVAFSADGKNLAAGTLIWNKDKKEARGDVRVWAVEKILTEQK
jgi:RNA polymerase sigma factor (sigma-70 family)